MATQSSKAVPSTSQPLESSTNGAKKLYRPRYIDIGINLTDPVFTGSYHGTQRHPNDLSGILQRAQEMGCEKMIITGSDLHESRKAVEMAKAHPGQLYATIGIHPCSCLQFTITDTPSTILSSLRSLALSAKASSHAVAFGEIGLDYDRLEHCPKDIQIQYFTAQLEIAVEVQLPLFLHSRAAHKDFLGILKRYEGSLPRRGVVHSFTGTKEEMWELVEGGWDIGVNGCSMKTEENCEFVREVPLGRLQVETDGPWCEIRGTHASMGYLRKMGVGKKEVEVKGKGKKQKGEVAGDNGTPDGSGVSTPNEAPVPNDSNGSKTDDTASDPGEDIVPLQEYKTGKKEKWQEGLMVKGRNEPCMIGHVAWAIAGIKGISVSEVTEAAWANSVRMFGIGEDGKARP